MKVSYIKALELWREQDHEDSIFLTRHEVIMLLDEINFLRGIF